MERANAPGGLGLVRLWRGPATGGVEVMFSERRDMAAALALFRSAKAVTSIIPDRVTTDGHGSFPRAIRTELRKRVRHRTSRYLNNKLEQDHWGLEGRCRPMRGFKCPKSAARFLLPYSKAALRVG